ncbi:MAG: C39 family peptidase [Candidatus Harrisonbacteria bacterium]|nr:C39 family peptidase [Candidatus Harrisonbacteria bacterium]MBI2604004.1 C39 family peptidase [Candidatus Harrisonbacteria bacterium]MBI3114752.1 C39 family peptidase [Candidatus Harrisonbacteria bacterium]
MFIHVDNVPFYSQFQDIPQVEWRREGCGVASLAMQLEFYTSKPVSVTKLLLEALEFGAYTKDVGWNHKRLAALADLYGLSGKNYDFWNATDDAAFNKLKEFLAGGPVMVSIHNKFNPKTTLGHLIVVVGIHDGTVVYHDPAYGIKKDRNISESDFLKGWKRRFIVVRERAEVTK